MHEQMIREFTRRAEATVELPDLAEIEDRARHRRRSRLTTLALAAAVILVAGTVAVTAGGDDDRAAPPPSEHPGVVLQDPVPDKELAAGRGYTVAVFGQNYAQTIPEGQLMITRFTVVGPGWIWLRDRVGKLGPGSDPVTPPYDYASVQISLVDRFPITQCTVRATRWQDAEKTPLGLARQITTVEGVQVIEQPETTVAYGYPSAHVQLRVPKVCVRSGDAILWSIFPSSSRGLAGVGTVWRSGQVVDLWILDVEGSMVAVSVDHSPGLPRSLMDELHAIADSVEFDLVRE